jgi:hypothetical protein
MRNQTQISLYPPRANRLSYEELVRATLILIDMATQNTGANSIFSIIAAKEFANCSFHWSKLTIAIKCATLSFFDEGDADLVGAFFGRFKPFYAMRLTYNLETARRYHILMLQQLMYDARTHRNFLRWARTYMQCYLLTWPKL